MVMTEQKTPGWSLAGVALAVVLLVAGCLALLLDEPDEARFVHLGLRRRVRRQEPQEFLSIVPFVLSHCDSLPLEGSPIEGAT